MKLRPLATAIAVIAVATVAGCSPAPSASRPNAAGGANQLGIDPGYRNLVRVTGYPASADAPVSCVNWSSEQSPSQLRFDCGGFTGGTCGSPWVTRLDPRTRTGTIVGVLGGYQQCGSTDAISYSSYLGEEVQRLYRQAVADETAPAG